MYRWFCGFYQKIDSYPGKYPEPLNGKRLWKDSTAAWACGSWKQKQIIVFSSGPIRLAILGNCFKALPELEKLFEVSVATGDYSRLMALSGSYSLIVNDGKTFCIYVDVAGLKPVFYTEYNNLIAYSSLAIPLYQLKNASIDEHWIASSLTGFPSQITTCRRSPFKHIYSVPPGHYLQISFGDVSCNKYWSEPQNYIDFSTARRDFRTQLINAVESRIQMYSDVSSDLSGGFDSTSLSLIAAKLLSERGQTLHTSTIATLSSDVSDDVKYARHATSLYSNIIPTMVEDQELPLEYSNLNEIPLTDAPAINTLSAWQEITMAEMMRSKGSQIHLAGVGADSVLSFPYSYLSELLNTAQIKSCLQYIYGWSRIWGFSSIALAKNVVSLNFTSYNKWLLHQANQFSSKRFEKESIASALLDTPTVGWSFFPGGNLAASWYTGHAISLVTEELRFWASKSLPFANSPAQNEVITRIHYSSSENRILQQLHELIGIDLEFPYFDSAIIDVCLSVKPNERTNPFNYKLLLSQALKHDIPDSIFRRNTKCDYSRDALQGLKHNLLEINSLLETSILSNMNLIDIHEFRDILKQVNVGIGFGWHFQQTLTVELWLHRILDNKNTFWKSKKSDFP